MSDLMKVSELGMSAFDEGVADEGGAFYYTKFKAGDWLYGEDQSPILPEQIFVVDVHNSAAKGFLCYVDGSVPSEVTALYKDVDSGADNFPKKSELKDYSPDKSGVYSDGDGWKNVLKIDFTDFQTGELYKYSTSTVGGTVAVSKLIKGYMQNARKVGKFQMPIVSLTSWDMPSKKARNKTKSVPAPEINIMGWVDTVELAKATGYKTIADIPKEGTIVPPKVASDDHVPF